MRKSGFSIFVAACCVTTAVFMAGCGKSGSESKNTDNPAKAVSGTSSTEATAQSSVSSQGSLPQDVLVRVGNWTLTTDEFKGRLKLLKQGLPEFKENDGNTKKMVLDELIRQQLLVKEAQDSGIGDSKEIKDAVDDFRKTLLVQELANRLTKDVAANENDARQWYDTNKDKFLEPVTWKIREIVVADEPVAKSILVQVLQGGDFAQIAQAQSKGKTAASGGEIKSFVTGKAPFVAMQAAIGNLEEGGVSSVFKGPDGYYIVKVESKKGGATKAFMDVKNDLINGLTMQKQQAAILEYLNKLAEKNKVEINKPLVDETTSGVKS